DVFCMAIVKTWSKFGTGGTPPLEKVYQSAVLDSLVPAPVVTPISIVPAAPAGETAVMEVGEFTVNEAAGAVPKRTAVAPVKPDPVTATAVPPVSDPLAGAMPATTGPLEVA